MMKRHLIHLLMAVLFLAACTSSVILMYNFSDNARISAVAMNAKKNKPSGQCTLTVPQGHADSSFLKKEGVPLNAGDVQQIAIDGKIYDIPLDMEKILSDFDYSIDSIDKKDDSGSYNIIITLYREELKILTINCNSDVKTPTPSEMVFRTLNLTSVGGVVQSRYMPELIIGGMDVRSVDKKEYLRLTGQENAEYIFTGLPFDAPDGTLTLLRLSESPYDDSPSDMLYGAPFIRGIYHGKNVEFSQKAWMVRTEYSLPEGDISLPEKVPYQTFMKNSDGEPITPDDLSSKEKNAYEYDISLYELMKLLDEKGMSTAFTISRPSACYVYEYDGEEYICAELTSEAMESDYKDIEVYVKKGYPVLAGTVKSIENAFYERLQQ